MLKLFVLALAVSSAAADFVRLQEVCRTTNENIGLCVTSRFCCEALGGTVEQEAQTKGVSRGAFPGSLASARSIGEDDGNKGCSYNGECCVFPEVDDYSCDICGLKGNGDISKENVGDRLVITTTTPEPEQVNKQIVERIVTGQDADRYEWCWQVALMNSSGLFGGGALIARNWVVTAAHKVAGKFLDDFVVVLGEYDFLHSVTNERVFYSTALNVFLHPGFNPETFDFNLALIRIPDAPCNIGQGTDQNSVCAVCLNEQTITFSTTTTTTTEEAVTTQSTTTTTPSTTTYAYGGSSGPTLNVGFSVENSLRRINMQQQQSVGGGISVAIGGSSPLQPNPFANMVCYMTGWGSTGTTQLAQVLQEANIGIIRNDVCEQAFQDVGVDQPYIPLGGFCGAETSLTRGSCYGDGGGPLVCQNRLDHTWELWGVISLGTNMCMPNAQQGPSIFVDIGAHYDWIVETVHDGLPDAADDEDSGKTYKVPECGSNVSMDGTKECPTAPPYEGPQGRSSNYRYRGPISQQQFAVLSS